MVFIILYRKDKAADRPRTNTILRDHLKNLVPFTEEWVAVMEACGQVSSLVTNDFLDIRLD